MIRNLHKVNDLLYRGAGPSVKDTRLLKLLGINKVVSLDQGAGDKIDRALRLLNIKHIMLPIQFEQPGSLLRFLNQDIFHLLQEGGPVFVHCIHGADRTGLAVALFRVLYQDWPCKVALKEARKYGFATSAMNDRFVKIIEKACQFDDHKPKGDYREVGQDDVNNAYDIVSNEREYPTNYNDYSLGAWEQQSWSPFEDYRVREYPLSPVDVYWPEQYDSRITTRLDDSDALSDEDLPSIPQVGQWDASAQGIMGAGPSMVGSGYI